MIDLVDSRGAPIPEPQDKKLEIKRWDIEATPINSPQVKRIIDNQFQQNFEPNICYTTTREVEKLLSDTSWDYAKLPNLPNRKTVDVFRGLPTGSSFLDVGCGSGTFIKQILDGVNPQLQAYGFDSRKWEDQQQIPHLVLGNIDDLGKIDFKGTKGFDVITCASVLYHLPDYWGAILRMTDRLKPDGVLLTSTIPRVVEVNNYGEVNYGSPVDDRQGKLTQGDNELIGYYRSRNILDTTGKLVPMSEMVQEARKRNPKYEINYSVVPSNNNGAQQYGGQIAVVRLGNEPFDLSNMFYCYHPFDELFSGLSYVMARNGQEEKLLQKNGYTSVQDRFNGK